MLTVRPSECPLSATRMMQADQMLHATHCSSCRLIWLGFASACTRLSGYCVDEYGGMKLSSTSRAALMSRLAGQGGAPPAAPGLPGAGGGMSAVPPPMAQASGVQLGEAAQVPWLHAAAAGISAEGLRGC